ncbi:gustatory receptor [Homalodisca vitripennis]|nr:gustatory receptor [Homalodisca vitripennis]
MQVFPKGAILTGYVFGGYLLTSCFVPNEGQELRFSPSWFTWSLISTAAQPTLPYYWVYLQYLNTLVTSSSYWTTNTISAVMILEYTYMSLTSVVVFVSNIRKYQFFVNFHKIVENVEDTWKVIRHRLSESRINISNLVAFVVTAALVTYDVGDIRIEQELARQCFGRLMENQYMPYIEISQESSNSQKCEVMKIYWLLVDAVHQANAFYCDQLKVTTSYLFFSDYIEFICASIWALASISYMVVMVRSATDVTKSADRTMMIICKTIHKDIDPAMRTKLERFLLQVKNNRPTFCGLHIFKIKKDILTKMAGAVTTYLVILLQFQNQNKES